MRVRARLASLVVLACLAACGGPGGDSRLPLAPGDIWIRDVTLISPERATPLEHAHVVLRQGRIVLAGTEPPGEMTSGITVIEGERRYLVPGLIDGHVHLAEVPGTTPQHVASMPAVAAAYFRQLPRSYLYFGFTAVADLNVLDRDRVDRLREADIGPTILDCGNALALANGYPMVYLPPAVRFDRYPNFLYDLRQADSIPAKYAATEHSPEAAVQRVADGGGECVKAYYERGFDPQVGKLPVPTEDLMRQVRDASERHGLPLLLHANSLDAHRFAAAVGVDAVVHGLWNWGASSADAGEGLPDPIREVLDAERNAGVGYMATSRVLSGLSDLFSPAFLDDPHLAHVLPANLLAWYRTPEARWFANELNPDGAPAERMRAGFDSGGRRHGAMRYVVRQGGRILFGSDTPSAPTYANPPGYNGYLELRELEAAGVSPRQLLAAATLENARLFRIEDRFGTIEVGKVASLLLLRDNPLDSTAAFDTIETVFVEGRMVRRETLSANGR